MIRTKKGNCVVEKGLEDFDFDYRKELSIYYFVKGERLSRGRMKLVDGEKKFNTHEEWKNYIKKKYNRLSVNELEEFRKYIQHVKRRRQPVLDFSSSYFSSILSVFGSYLVTEKFVDVKPETEKIIAFIAYVILFMVIFITIACLLKACISSLTADGVENGFFTDYQEVMDEMINEKVVRNEIYNQEMCESIKKVEQNIENLQKNVKDINNELEQLHEQFKESCKKDTKHDRKREEKNEVCEVIKKLLRSVCKVK